MMNLSKMGAVFGEKGLKRREKHEMSVLQSG